MTDNIVSNVTLDQLESIGTEAEVKIILNGYEEVQIVTSHHIFTLWAWKCVIFLTKSETIFINDEVEIDLEWVICLKLGWLRVINREKLIFKNEGKKFISFKTKAVERIYMSEAGNIDYWFPPK